MWSQCGDVTGGFPCRLSPFFLGSVAAAGATGGEELLARPGATRGLLSRPGMKIC